MCVGTLHQRPGRYLQRNSRHHHILLMQELPGLLPKTNQKVVKMSPLRTMYPSYNCLHFTFSKRSSPCLVSVDKVNSFTTTYIFKRAPSAPGQQTCLYFPSSPAAGGLYCMSQDTFLGSIWLNEPFLSEKLLVTKVFFFDICFNELGRTRHWKSHIMFGWY